LAKMEENKNIVLSKISFSKIVNYAVDDFEVLAVSKNRELITDISDDIYINGDEEGLKQLLNLLIDNAIKYSKSDSKIKINLKRDKKNKWAILSVQNPCDDIKESDLSKLFDRFYRADSSRSRETGGSGIGLAVAKQIVENHNGTIHASKIGVNEIEFAVKIPALSS